MTSGSAASHAVGIEFLENLQLVLAESQANSTYKYALLHAIADICVEGQDIGAAELRISIKHIADKFLALYWRHGLPYGRGIRDAAAGVILQNRRNQAKVVSQTVALRERFGSLYAARRDARWTLETRRLAAHLDEMPLWRLQRIRTRTLDFLYPENRGGTDIVLRPGIAACFRRFYGLVIRLVQAEWMAFLYTVPANWSLLGSSGDLAEFLFGSQRESLAVLQEPLANLQSNRCFYCEQPLNPLLAEVDHFIPWSRYPRNLIHNLVLADRRCNSSKSDILPGRAFYERWTAYIDARDGELHRVGERTGFLADRNTSIHVANWCYQEAARMRADVWLGGESFAPLT